MRRGAVGRPQKQSGGAAGRPRSRAAACVPIAVLVVVTTGIVEQTLLVLRGAGLRPPPHNRWRHAGRPTARFSALGESPGLTLAGEVALDGPGQDADSGAIAAEGGAAPGEPGGPERDADASATAAEGEATLGEPEQAADAGAMLAKPAVFRLQKNQQLQGTITKFIGKGMFVDVGVGKDGFVHLSKVGDGRAKKADDIYALGEELPVWVTKVKTDGRLELTCRPPVDLSGFRDVQPNQWLSGVVTAIDPSGLYIKVDPPGGGHPQQGKVKKKDIRKGRVRDPNKEAEIGEEVRVRVTEVDEKAGRLGLSLRGL